MTRRRASTGRAVRERSDGGVPMDALATTANLGKVRFVDAADVLPILERAEIILRSD